MEGSVTDFKLVEKLVLENDYIIHLAAIVGVRLAMENGIEGLKVSCMGTENVLNCVAKYNKKLLAASSSAIYGKISKTPVSEDTDSIVGCSAKSSWLYSIAKLAEEHFCLAYHRELGCDVKVCRFFNAVGPNQSKSYGMVMPNFISNALSHRTLQIYGDGNQSRTFVYIEDLLDGIELVIEKGTTGEVYNIGGTEEIKIADLARKIIDITESGSDIEFIPFEKVFGPDYEETMQRMPDITKLKALGYNPQYTLEKSISSLIKHLKLRKDI
ncbi:NAD-dependent epimerase/dehydratase family protein [Aminipila terrae]|uniref:NAD-dependent epimerase/dehydratase family protein n=1 Tax=Aminipila terrae TaxID=2697030 RepID=A0A6P1MSK9_9FIRM|nr:NAD-dependent epimerase/dehydratase family protein [Aminipila terrae]QHI73995.1 NAD-dependent epimerase/dehydratase family protein [Aminipila terrae]